MIKVTVFGSGSKGNAYLLDDGRSSLIIESGVRFKEVQQKLRYKLSNIVGCLITHEHTDHCQFVKQYADGLNCDFYATRGTLNHLDIDQYRKKVMKYKIQYSIGDWKVAAFETKHNSDEPCGFQIISKNGDKLIFITDSYYVRYKFPDVDYLMIEANYSREIIEKTMTEGYNLKRKTDLLEHHFDIENTLKFIQMNKSDHLKEVWLLHLSDANSNEQEFKESVQRLTGVPVYVA